MPGWLTLTTSRTSGPSRIAVPRATIHAYLSRNIHYTLDDECLEGLRRFYQLAAACDVLPAMTDLKLL